AAGSGQQVDSRQEEASFERPNPRTQRRKVVLFAARCPLIKGDAMSALVETQNVTQIFGNPKKEHTVALDDFSFSISESVPSFTAIVGESGSGKTTLARILLGFQY